MKKRTSRLVEMSPRTLRELKNSPPSSRAVQALTKPTALTIRPDEYMRETVYGMQVGRPIHLPTPWGYYALKLDADGMLEVYMATNSGGTRTIHVAPKVTNVIEIHPVEL